MTTHPRSVTLDGETLDIEGIWAIGCGAECALAPAAIARMEASRRFVETALARGEVVYGVNTGFGKLATVRVAASDLDQLQKNLIRSHACGVGEPLPMDVVRASMALRANVLSRGHSGVRPGTASQLVKLLNARVHPVIPSLGSVGASGDLAPLAHVALVLIGEGQAEVDGHVVPGAEALHRRGLAPLRLAPKEGIALVNGTQVTAAIGALAAREARTMLETANVVGALSLDALRGSARAFDARMVEARPHPGAIRTAKLLSSLLEGSPIIESHKDCGRVQDAYSLRCMPQVHGAAWDALDHAWRVLSVEINSSTDNPMVLAGDDGASVLAGGNFHGAPVGLVLDYLAIALCQAASMSERRIERLCNPDLSDLPAFLVKDGGLNSGLMMAQTTAAALVSECKVLCHPASVDSIPTSANKEDHVPMSTHASRKCRQVVDLFAHVLAIEALAAAQALDLLAPLRTSARLEGARHAIRERIPYLERDREVARDISAALGLVRSGELAGAAGVEVTVH
ncbi:MAG: histidine ammonia-lyase [Acidobacteriota bacterium]